MQQHFFPNIIPGHYKLILHTKHIHRLTPFNLYNTSLVCVDPCFNLKGSACITEAETMWCCLSVWLTIKKPTHVSNCIAAYHFYTGLTHYGYWPTARERPARLYSTMNIVTVIRHSKQNIDQTMNWQKMPHGWHSPMSNVLAIVSTLCRTLIVL